jgi:hypothetical protein
MYEKIPVAILNKEFPRIFKKNLHSFIDKHKDDMVRFPLTIGINNKDRQSVIDLVLEDVLYVKDILYRDITGTNVTFTACLSKMLPCKSEAVVFIPSGYICIKSLVTYVNDMLFILKNDDTIGGFYLGRNKLSKEKFTGKSIVYKELLHNNFYKTSLGFQFEPFLLSVKVAIEMLKIGDNKEKLNKWYISEGYQTLGIEGGCFQKYD